MPFLRHIDVRLSLVLSLALACTAASAAHVKTLGSQGAWRAMEKFDPFADPQRECAVHSTGLDANTARRKRPRLRIYPGRGRLIVDPSYHLTQATSALGRILEGRRGGDTRFPQFLPKNQLHYQLRVDDGEIVERTSKPDFESWQAQRDMPDFDAFIDAMASGTTLYVSWRLDRAREGFQYPLAGFAEMLALTREACPAQAASNASGAPNETRPPASPEDEQ